jgi:cytochrome b pre-mRNA-processing protein 3
MLKRILEGIGLARTADPVPAALYGAVVAQARQPVFYGAYGFPDTVTGRFDVLGLHMFLLTRRLAADDNAAIARPLGQEVFDTFAGDIDRALRELGIGDTSVPKKKRQLVHGYYAQIDELSPPLDAGDASALAQRLGARFVAVAEAGKAEALASYVIAARQMLSQSPLQALASGKIAFPDPGELAS